MRRKPPMMLFQFPVLLIVSACSALIASLPTTRDSTRMRTHRLSSSKQIQIFDNVIDKKRLLDLHELASEHSDRSNDESSIFYRPSDTLTPLESALDSILTEIGDTSHIVEYWSRDEYMNIELHSDIDETELEEDGIIRCPEWGHVLYLVVSEGLRGPTCLFTDQLGGWNDEINALDLHIVPAVESRVLRFRGSAMHAVPRPANKWILSSTGTTEEVRSAAAGHDRSLVEDEINEEDDDVIERSVVLFNTWKIEPPRGVKEDYTGGILPDGIEVPGVDMDEYEESMKRLREKEWRDNFGENFELVHCEKRESWAEFLFSDNPCDDAPINSDDSSFAMLKVGLMGKKDRRISSQAFVKLLGSRERVESALVMSKDPSSIRLQTAGKSEDSS